jgi:hypothetical protein
MLLKRIYQFLFPDAPGCAYQVRSRAFIFA